MCVCVCVCVQQQAEAKAKGKGAGWELKGHQETPGPKAKAKGKALEGGSYGLKRQEGLLPPAPSGLGGDELVCSCSGKLLLLLLFITPLHEKKKREPSPRRLASLSAES
jgi:hypothetical protein